MFEPVRARPTDMTPTQAGVAAAYRHTGSSPMLGNGSMPSTSRARRPSRAYLGPVVEQRELRDEHGRKAGWKRETIWGENREEEDAYEQETSRGDAPPPLSAVGRPPSAAAREMSAVRGIFWWRRRGRLGVSCEATRRRLGFLVFLSIAIYLYFL